MGKNRGVLWRETHLLTRRTKGRVIFVGQLRVLPPSFHPHITGLKMTRHEYPNVAVEYWLPLLLDFKMIPRHVNGSLRSRALYCLPSCEFAQTPFIFIGLPRNSCDWIRTLRRGCVWRPGNSWVGCVHEDFLNSFIRPHSLDCNFPPFILILIFLLIIKLLKAIDSFKSR